MVPVLKHHPSIWVAALLVTLVLLAVSVIGVTLAAKAETQNRLLAAQGARCTVVVGSGCQPQPP